MVSTLVIDVDALTLLRERLGDVRLPAGFESDWGRAADPTLVAVARAGAGQRLRTAGLLVPTDPSAPEGRGGTEGGGSPGGVDGPAAGEDVHPSLRAALEGFGRAGLQLEVRSWAGDRALLAHLAVGVDAGIGLARLQRVNPDGPDSGSGPNGSAAPVDAVGVELAVFEPGDVLAAIERLLPPLPAPPAPAPMDAARTAADPLGPNEPVRVEPVRVEPVRVGWQPGLALLTLLRRHDAIGFDQLPVAREVLRILLDSAGLATVPPLLNRLAGPLEAAVRITLSAADRTGGENLLWFGYWLQCGGQLVGLRAEPGPAANPTGPPANPTGPTLETSDPDSPADSVLTLVPTDGPGLRADLVLALTAAFVASGLAEGER